MRFQRLKQYLEGPFVEVNGWCSPNLWQALQPIVEIQDSLGINNPVAEIGVYHGKFFFGLLETKGALAGNYAIDVFDAQQFNLDGAGRGSREIFLENAVKCGIDPVRIKILECDSMAITAAGVERILEGSLGFSLFSVDGCHLPEHTVNDVELAMRLTVPEGIIFVDDYTNVDWPGVQEGIAKMYFSGYPRFVPLLVAHNKLFLCHISYHKRFVAAVIKRMEAMKIRTKLVRRFGYDSLSVHLDPNMKNYVYDPAGSAANEMMTRRA